MSENDNNSGFVLLIVLVVLTVAGTVLAAAARRCGREALEAGSAQRALQVKWGALSSRAVILPSAAKILGARAMEDSRPRASLRWKVVMGGVPFDLILSDEQSKANVNMLVHRFGRDVAAASLAELQSRLRRAFQVRLRPAEVRAGVISAVPIRYVGLDQVLVFEHPSELVDADPESEEASALGRITCWGGGKVNFKSAEACVIRRVAAGVLTETQVAQLVEFRESSPDCTLAEAVRQLQLTKKTLTALNEVLTDESRCHSLWVVGRGRTRSWYRLYVDQLGDMENDSQQWSFQW